MVVLIFGTVFAAMLDKDILIPVLSTRTSGVRWENYGDRKSVV